MTSAPNRRAVFLDRDGVIIEPILDPRSGTAESPYCADDVRLIHGAAEALGAFRTLGVALVVVSNQPAAAKGTVGLDALKAVHERTVMLLANSGVELDAWEYCFHHPAGVIADLAIECRCRKPRPGMLLRAARRLRIDLERSWMVGDSATDVLAGRAAGTRVALAEHPSTQHRRNEAVQADLFVPDLASFAAQLETEARVG